MLHSLQSNLTKARTNSIDTTWFNTGRLTEPDYQKDAEQDIYFRFITKYLDFQSFWDIAHITHHLMIPRGSQNNFEKQEERKFSLLL